MATRRSTRVTQVNPWIAGGEGQLRDLFPLTPPIFFALKALGHAVRHWLITITLFFALYLWWLKDWGWFPAFIIFPLGIALIHLIIVVFYLWYKNPTIPLFVRKPR